MIVETVDLMASIVRYDDKRMKEATKDLGYKLLVLDVLPSIIVDFAQKSRVSSGYRLLKRCIRHALDPKAFPLEHRKAHLF